jgi:secreted Zn-dependent insulinase-like peptidase
VCVQYIALLRECPEKEWKRMFNEMQALSYLRFRFKDREGATTYANSLAYTLHYAQPAHVVSAGDVFPDFSFSAIRSILDCLVPANMWLYYVSKANQKKTDQKAPWYDTPFSENKWDSKLDAALKKLTKHSSLALPPPNPYVTSDFSLVARPNSSPLEREVEPPALVLSGTEGEVWHKLDCVFLKPKANLRLRVISLVCDSSVINSEVE